MRFRIVSNAVCWGTMTLLFLMATLTRGLPSGFIAEVVSNTNAISGIFAPNPKNGDPLLILVNKNGRVTALQDPDNNDSEWETILDLAEEICTNGERGLQQAVIHPDFEKNRLIYLFYTKFKEGCLEDVKQAADLHPYNVIARFTMDEETLMLDFDSREEIWRGMNLRYSLHNGGAMLFGNDGKLYVTHGESGVQENAQNLNNVAGTLLRLNDDGSTPDDNPFSKKNGYDAYDCRDSEGSVPTNNTSDNTVCSEIFALGLRNPFRMSLDPNEKDKTLFSIQDVGGRTWEELSYGGTDYAGMNYGWKPYEGPCKRHSATDCPVPDDPNMVDPFHYYIHRSDKSGCVSGAAFVPEGVWPEEHTFLFADFVFSELYSLTEDPDGGCRTCSPPVSKFKNETFFAPVRYPGDAKNTGRILDVFFGPYEDTQALYVILYGKESYRIRYTGIHDDPPLAKFIASKQHVDVDEEIQFDGSESYDPEGEEISFQWFFGEGSKSTEATPTHTYEKRGNYEVTLFVTDALNQVQQKSISIMVGDPPTAEIMLPAEGDEFYVGEVLRLEGKAEYQNGTQFEDDQLQWEVRKHHDDHYHPFLAPTYGNKLDLSPAPEPEDFYASTNSYLEIILYATDDVGLTRKVSRYVQPSLVEVGIDSNLEGSRIEVNGEEVSAFSSIVSWKDQQLNLNAKSDSTHQFVSWSDGFEEQTRSVVVNHSVPVVSANFCALNGAMCSEQVQCCSGYCIPDVLGISPIRGSAIQKSANVSETSMFCSESTVAPTTSPTTSPTITPSKAPAVVMPSTELEETLVPDALDDDATTETESTASEVISLNLFSLAVSLAITALMTI